MTRRQVIVELLLSYTSAFHPSLSSTGSQDCNQEHVQGAS